MTYTGYGVYQEAQARDLDQAKLILMMYSGAINFLDRSIESEKNDIIKMRNFVSKSKNVIYELMASLNIDEGGEMGELLMRTYQSFIVKLNNAQVQDDTEKISEVRNDLSKLQHVWKQVFESEDYERFKEGR